MGKESRDYLEIAFRSIECFTNDGTLQVGELDKLLEIALRDGVVDSNEKRVLKNIISRLTPAELTPEMQQKISHIQTAYGL